MVVAHGRRESARRGRLDVAILAVIVGVRLTDKTPDCVRRCCMIGVRICQGHISPGSISMHVM
jgi:hypothetical protein